MGSSAGWMKKRVKKSRRVYECDFAPMSKAASTTQPPLKSPCVAMTLRTVPWYHYPEAWRNLFKGWKQWEGSSHNWELPYWQLYLKELKAPQSAVTLLFSLLTFLQEMFSHTAVQLLISKTCISYLITLHQRQIILGPCQVYEEVIKDKTFRQMLLLRFGFVSVTGGLGKMEMSGLQCFCLLPAQRQTTVGTTSWLSCKPALPGTFHS